VPLYRPVLACFQPHVVSRCACRWVLVLVISSRASPKCAELTQRSVRVGETFTVRLMTGIDFVFADNHVAARAGQRGEACSSSRTGDARGGHTRW